MRTGRRHPLPPHPAAWFAVVLSPCPTESRPCVPPPPRRKWVTAQGPGRAEQQLLRDPGDLGRVPSHGQEEAVLTFIIVQTWWGEHCRSVARSCPALCNPMDWSMPGFFTISQSLLKLMSIESVMPSERSFVAPFSSCPQCFPMSWLFKSGSQSIGASASVLPLEYSELPSFRIDRSYVIGISVSTLLFHFHRRQDTM